MKKSIIFLFVVFSLPVLAQTEWKEGMLLFRFRPGIVTFNDGSKAKSIFNYYTVEEKMFFLDEISKETMTFANTSNIIGITIDSRFFEKARGNAFYERIDVGDDSFYVRWKSRVVSTGKEGAYGTRSQSAGITNYQKNEDASHGDLAKFSQEDGIRNDIDCEFYLKINGTFKKFDSAKSLSKLIGGHLQELEKFVQENNISFKKIEDVKILIAYTKK